MFYNYYFTDSSSKDDVFVIKKLLVTVPKKPKNDSVPFFSVILCAKRSLVAGFML